MKIYNYKIYLNECKNNHRIDNILIKEFENKQYINQNEIICNTYKIYLCPICKKEKDDKNHNIR